jgi:three-Cys-motif partner protein
LGERRHSHVKELGQQDRLYIDLFAGPGRYKDGTASTPLRVLSQAIEHPDMRNMLVTMFNDVDPEHVNSLEKAINALPGIEKLKYKPDIDNKEVGSEIVQEFEKMKLVPTLFFVDPWGYKGLSLRLVNSVLKDWGCDCIFFFNYNRISMGLANEKVEEHMNALFGKERADKLRAKINGLDPGTRCRSEGHGRQVCIAFPLQERKGRADESPSHLC